MLDGHSPGTFTPDFPPGILSGVTKRTIADHHRMANHGSCPWQMRCNFIACGVSAGCLKENYRGWQTEPRRLSSFQIIKPDTPGMAVEPDLMSDRRMRPLRTIHTLADSTTDAEGIQLAAL